MNDTLRLVFWELTARCNLHCQHCRAEAQEEFAKGELTTEEILSVARDIWAAGDPIIVLTGGEPLVRGDFFEIAKECSSLFTRVALATNGTLVDATLAARIVEAGIERVSVSLDGANAETHDAFRGVPGSFQDTLNGYDALKQAGASMQVNVTVTQHNVQELDAILELALERGADAFHVFVLVPVGCGAKISENVRLSKRQNEDVLRWLFEKSIDLRDRMHIKATCAPQYYRIMREVSQERGLELPRQQHGLQAITRGCLAGSAVCFISRTGDVQPCGYLPVRIGNVREKPFDFIWRESDVFAALRDAGQLEGKCGTCEYRRICAGCRARAYAAVGDFLAEDPDCSYVREP